MLRQLSGRCAAAVVAALMLVGCAATGDGSGSSGDAPELEHLTHVHGLAVPWWDDGQLLVATHRGLVSHTVDGWQVISEEPHDLMGFAIDGSRDRVLYGSGHPSLTSDLENPLGLIVSDDAGVTWSVRSLAGAVDFHRLVVARDTDTMLGLDATGARLLASGDGGTTWDELHAPTTDAITDLAISDDGTVIAVATADALLLRDPDGAWSTELDGSPVTAVGFRPGSNDQLIAAGVAEERTLIASGDAGRSWIPIPLEVGDSFVVHLEITDDAMYVGTNDDSILVSRDDGASWQLLADRGVPL